MIEVEMLEPVLSEHGNATAPSGAAYDLEPRDGFASPDADAVTEWIIDRCPDEMLPGAAMKLAADIVNTTRFGGRIVAPSGGREFEVTVTDARLIVEDVAPGTGSPQEEFYRQLLGAPLVRRMRVERGP
jgi:hypothetical protein